MLTKLKDQEMKHLRTVAIIALLLFAMNVFSWGILKQGDKFLPFSLVSSHDEIYTVTLVDGKLTVTIQPMEGGEERVMTV